MEATLEFGLSIVIFLQNIGEWLLVPMKVLTFLGNEEFFILLAPAVYWCLDSRLGLKLGLFLMVSATVNASLKILVHSPRPYWYDPQISAYTSESSFGIPSGHAQNAVVVWGTFAQWLKRTWGWVIAILLMVLIGLSRAYLGVHFPTDLLIGWLVGIVILVLLLLLEHPIRLWFSSQAAPNKYVYTFIISFVLILFSVLARFSLGAWVLPQVWVDNASIALPDEELINPLDLSGAIGNSGAFFGLAAGAILLASRGSFDPHGTWLQLLTRYLVGVIGVLLIWRGLGVIFPRGEYLLAYGLRYLRYALIGMWVTGLAPLLFARLKLATITPHKP